MEIQIHKMEEELKKKEPKSSQKRQEIKILDSFDLKNFEKLDFFMRMIMPSFIRLIGGEEAATALIKGFIECIGSKNDGLEAPKELVDDVLDAIGLFLLKLNMDAFQILIV